jgi:HK97 family phage portal protein
MSIIRSLLERPSRETRAEFGNDVAELLAQRRKLSTTTSGTVVTYDSALTLWAVFAAVNVIADTVSHLPVATYRGRDETRTRIETPDHVEQPDYLVSGSGWRRQVLVSLLLRGNAWGHVLVRHPDTLRPMVVRIAHPDDVTVTRRGKLDDPVTKISGVEVSPVDLFHMGAYEMPGLPIGISPISYAAQAIGLGLAAERFGAQWFADGAHPSGLLVYDGPLTAEQASVAKERFAAGLDGSREPTTLGDGWAYTPISVAADESQFLETIQANAATVAVIFGLRPEDIGQKSGDSMTYANVEQRQISRLM